MIRIPLGTASLFFFDFTSAFRVVFCPLQIEFPFVLPTRKRGDQFSDTMENSWWTAGGGHAIFRQPNDDQVTSRPPTRKKKKTPTVTPGAPGTEVSTRLLVFLLRRLGQETDLRLVRIPGESTPWSHFRGGWGWSKTQKSYKPTKGRHPTKPCRGHKNSYPQQEEHEGTFSCEYLILNIKKVEGSKFLGFFFILSWRLDMGPQHKPWKPASALLYCTSL